MKAFRLVLFFILVGTRMQRVKAVEEDSARNDRIIETVHTHRADSRNMYKRMEFCERE